MVGKRESLSGSTKPAERPLGLSRGAGFEGPAGVFAGHGADMTEKLRSPKLTSAGIARIYHRMNIALLTDELNPPVSGSNIDVRTVRQSRTRTGLGRQRRRRIRRPATTDQVLRELSLKARSAPDCCLLCENARKMMLSQTGEAEL